MALPRFPAPIALEHIKVTPAPPNMFELLESMTAVSPIGQPAQTIGMGVGIAAIPGEAVPAVGTTAGPPKPREPREPREPSEPRIRMMPDDGAVVAAVQQDAAVVAAAQQVAEAAAAVPVELTGDLAEKKAQLEAAMGKQKIGVNPVTFVPSNRRAFKQFIIQAFRRYHLPAPPAVPDPDACAKSEAASKKEVKTFAYQSFVRDYMQRPSPYRGVLVYHGLGSGKTCTSIAAFEALYQAGHKPVYIMTPASLNPNYRDEITKCGPFIFRTNNHWTWLSVPSLRAPTPESEMLLKVIGLPRYSVQKRKGGWLPNPTKAPNFETLAPAQRQQIQEQIKEHMDARIQFIHYNGIQEKTVRKWACDEPTKFDGATIIIDEVHNLIRTINNSNLEHFYKDEPRALAQYHPKFCEVGVKYRISYLLYRILCNAVGTKIIALSATPIINFPQEIAILANLLSGDTRMVEVNIPGLDKRARILDILGRHPEVDFAEVLPRPEIDNTSLVRITPVPSGYRKVIDPASGAFRGFVREDRLAQEVTEIARERDLPAWFARVKDAIATAGVATGEPQFRSVERLPDVEKNFREMFIDTEKLQVKSERKVLMMARLSGLISYYKGGKADLMARTTRDEVVAVDMSDLQLKKYTEQRKPEIDKELKQSKKKPAPAAGGAGVAVGYADATKNQNSTFKIFSRAACNFAFPDDVARPIPADYRDALRMIGAKVGRVKEDGEADEEVEVDITEAEGVEEDIAAAAVAEGVAAPVAVAPKKEGFSEQYKAAIAAAITTLRERAGDYFSKGNLVTYSPKFQAILDKLLETKGPALIYSNFKTLEGVGLFGLALESQQGYKKFDIVQSGGAWVLSPETLTAGPGTHRYITYTGDEDRQKRNILLAIFNNKWNKVPASLAAQVKELVGTETNIRGEIARVFMITQSGAEGISLTNVRQVHLMEPYWNYVRIDQVKGRAIRICSHMELPPEERTVDVFTYVAKFSDRQKRDRLVDETLVNFDGGESTDQAILKLLIAKKRLADSILDVMKASAVDCELNALENGVGACYRFAGDPTMEPVFHPLVDVDISSGEGAVRARGGL